jgi:hypothetical protein
MTVSVKSSGPMMTETIPYTSALGSVSACALT